MRRARRVSSWFCGPLEASKVVPGGCRSAFSFLLFEVTGFAVAFGSIALQWSLTWRKLRLHINHCFEVAQWVSGQERSRSTSQDAGLHSETTRRRHDSHLGVLQKTYEDFGCPSEALPSF
jgi:hypothetical protein